MEKLVILDGHTLNPGDLDWSALTQHFDSTIHPRTIDTDIINRMQGAGLALTNKVPFSKETLAQLPQLKYIGVLATGYNIIDIKAAREQGITVTNIPAYSTASVAQHVFALLLDICQNIALHNASVHQGDWVASTDFCYWRSPLTELAGLTIGLVGFGEIGQKVANIAQAFGMNILLYKPRPLAKQHPAISQVSLEELCAQSDVISLHCPLNDDTRHIINKTSLSQMKNSAILINTGRGDLIDEQALSDALNQDQVRAAGLDVLSQEPPKADNPLLSAKNCVITPHIAWASLSARQRLLQIAIKNIIGFVNNSPVNVVSG